MIANRLLIAAAVTTTIVGVSTVEAGTNFIIRNGSSSSTAPVIQPNNTYVSGATEFIISESGQKAAWGSNNLNGSTIDKMRVSVTRHDDTTRFSIGSGPAVAPYFNLWVTDGLGNYAVIANEPSNPAFQPLFTTNLDGSKTYDLDFSDLSDKVAKVYETPGAGAGTSWVHTAVGKTSLTFADLAAFKIEAPSATYIGNPVNAVGTGAPDRLSDSAAWGFNWVFGDTLSNYVSGQEGYVVSNLSATVVPVPGAGLAGIGLIGLIALKRRRRAA